MRGNDGEAMKLSVLVVFVVPMLGCSPREMFVEYLFPPNLSLSRCNGSNTEGDLMLEVGVDGKCGRGIVLRWDEAGSHVMFLASPEQEGQTEQWRKVADFSRRELVESLAQISRTTETMPMCTSETEYYSLLVWRCEGKEAGYVDGATSYSSNRCLYRDEIALSEWLGRQRPFDHALETRFAADSWLSTATNHGSL